LESLIALAAFTPVLAYLSDAAGTQSETLAVRRLALDPKISIRAYLIREAKVAFILALVCGMLLGLAAAVADQPCPWSDSGHLNVLSIIAAIRCLDPIPIPVPEIQP